MYDTPEPGKELTLKEKNDLVEAYLKAPRSKGRIPIPVGSIALFNTKDGPRKAGKLIAVHPCGSSVAMYLDGVTHFVDGENLSWCSPEMGAPLTDDWELAQSIVHARREDVLETYREMEMYDEAAKKEKGSMPLRELLIQEISKAATVASAADLTQSKAETIPAFPPGPCEDEPVPLTWKIGDTEYRNRGGKQEARNPLNPEWVTVGPAAPPGEDPPQD